MDWTESRLWTIIIKSFGGAPVAEVAAHVWQLLRGCWFFSRHSSSLARRCSLRRRLLENVGEAYDATSPAADDFISVVAMAACNIIVVAVAKTKIAVA
jgi:hypothetical protein